MWSWQWTKKGQSWSSTRGDSVPWSLEGKKSCVIMSSKKIFLARGWIFGCASIQGYTHLKIGTTKSHFHGPEFDFPFLMQKLLVINGAIGVLTSHPLAHVWCTWSSLFFPSFKIDWVDFFGTDKHNSRISAFYSVMSLIGKTSVRHLTGAPPQSFQVPPLISSVGKIMIFKTFFPLLPSIFEADPGLSRL